MPNRMAYLLKKQKGKCSWCGLTFQEWDEIEDDHIIPQALGSKDEWKNRQLLDQHCHIVKTASDGRLKSVMTKESHSVAVCDKSRKHGFRWEGSMSRTTSDGYRGRPI